MAFRWSESKHSRAVRGGDRRASASRMRRQAPSPNVGVPLGAGREHRLAAAPSLPFVSRRVAAPRASARLHGRRILLLTLLLLAPSAAATRVVSLNLCTDQLLVLLAPEQIAALSPLARDPALSFVARRAASLPIVRPSAEAVLRLHPDLILAGPYGAPTTVALLQSEGLAVHRITLPQTFAGIRAQTVGLATLLGVPQRGAALIRAMNATLAAIRRPSRRVTAIAWEPHGFADGPATLTGAVLRAAGLTNLSDGHRLGVEAVMRIRPDLLVVQQAPDFPSLATDLLHSPVLASIPRRALPPALTLCAGPFTAQAVAMLAR
jgi:iron complex transport system substrate-binding protein